MSSRRWAGALLAIATLAAIAAAVPAQAQAAPCERALTGAGNSTAWDLSDSAGDFSDGTMITPVGLDALRDDAFDGYGQVAINNLTYFNGSTGGCKFRRLRKAGREAIFPASEVAPEISARPRLFVHRKKPLGRQLVTIRNTGNAPQTISFAWRGDLGSDSNTKVYTSSNGDPSMTAVDRWAVTCEDGKDDGCAQVSTDPYRDPELAHNWEGKGKKKHSADLVFDAEAEEGSLRFQFDDVRIGPGKSVVFMQVVSLAPTAKRARALARAIDRRPGKAGVFAGLSKRQRKALQNW